MTKLDFDELHTLVDASLATQDVDGVIETIRGLLTNAYERAVADMEEEFEYIYLYYPEMLGLALEKPIDGLTWEERIRSWFNGENPNTATETAQNKERETEEPEEETEESEERTKESEKPMTYENISEAIKRVVDTEYHRMYETGAYDTATAMKEDGKNIYKRWVTMMDERVRDTHSYIEGELVPLDEEFYTFDGDSAQFPGGFALPQNNINCRCWIEYEVI